MDQPVDPIDIERVLQRLLNAIGRGAHKDADLAYRTLYDIGEPAIPRLQATLYRDDYAELNRLVMARLTGVLTLTHDIDCVKSRETAEEIRRRGCDPVYDARLATILAYAPEHFLQYEVKGIEVHESDSLKPDNRLQFVTKWLGGLPPEDLKEIRKIYLIPRGQEDYRGTYTPYLNVIALVWDEPFGRNNPFSALNALSIERTFYHEVGHHVHRHTYGQDPVQEEEAEAYAIARMRAAHPRFRAVARWLWSVRPRLGFMKWLGSRLRQRRPI